MADVHPRGGELAVTGVIDQETHESAIVGGAADHNELLVLVRHAADECILVDIAAGREVVLTSHGLHRWTKRGILRPVHRLDVVEPGRAQTRDGRDGRRIEGEIERSKRRVPVVEHLDAGAGERVHGARGRAGGDCPCRGRAASSFTPSKRGLFGLLFGVFCLLFWGLQVAGSSEVEAGGEGGLHLLQLPLTEDSARLVEIVRAGRVLLDEGGRGEHRRGHRLRDEEAQLEDSLRSDAGGAQHLARRGCRVVELLEARLHSLQVRVSQIAKEVGDLGLARRVRSNLPARSEGRRDGVVAELVVELIRPPVDRRLPLLQPGAERLGGRRDGRGLRRGGGGGRV